MKNSILLIILFSVFSIIGLDDLSKILPVSIDKVLKHSNHLNKKAKPIASSSSAFRCKYVNAAAFYDPTTAAIAVFMPRSGEPAIEYRYGDGFIRYSEDNNYFFTFQGDGNLVMYKTSTGQAVWASNTYHKGEVLAFQPDNNIVIYDNRGRGVWDSGTMGYCLYSGQPGSIGVTLYFNKYGKLLLRADDGAELGNGGTGHIYGDYFLQNYSYP